MDAQRGSKMVRKLILMSCLLVTGCVAVPNYYTPVYINPAPVIHEPRYVCDRWLERGRRGRLYTHEHCYWARG